MTGGSHPRDCRTAEERVCGWCHMRESVVMTHTPLLGGRAFLCLKCSFDVGETEKKQRREQGSPVCRGHVGEGHQCGHCGQQYVRWGVPLVWVASITPPYAAATVDGRKGAELRRTACRFAPGDRVFIYETKPRAEVIGEAVVERVETVPVEQLVGDDWRARHLVSEPDLRRYAGERPTLTVIVWREAHRWSRSMPLGELRGLGVQPSPTWVRAPQPLVAAVDEREATERASNAAREDGMHDETPWEPWTGSYVNVTTDEAACPLCLAAADEICPACWERFEERGGDKARELEGGYLPWMRRVMFPDWCAIVGDAKPAGVVLADLLRKHGVDVIGVEPSPRLGDEWTVRVRDSRARDGYTPFTFELVRHHGRVDITVVHPIFGKMGTPIVVNEGWRWLCVRHVCTLLGSEGRRLIEAYYANEKRTAEVRLTVPAGTPQGTARGDAPPLFGAFRFEFRVVPLVDAKMPSNRACTVYADGDGRYGVRHDNGAVTVYAADGNEVVAWKPDDAPRSGEAVGFYLEGLADGRAPYDAELCGACMRAAAPAWRELLMRALARAGVVAAGEAPSEVSYESAEAWVDEARDIATEIDAIEGALAEGAPLRDVLRPLLWLVKAPAARTRLEAYVAEADGGGASVRA